MKQTRKLNTKTMVMGALLTALVILLEVISASLGKAGMFRFTFALVPIAIGAATCGIGISAWLGLVFGLTVLLTGDAAAFLAVNPVGTVITVLVKGIVCGMISAWVYQLLAKKNNTLAIVASALVCPFVNTGVFLVGCLLFFMETVTEWATMAGLGGNVGQYMILGLVGINFLFELVSTIVLTPVVVRILNIRKKA